MLMPRWKLLWWMWTVMANVVVISGQLHHRYTLANHHHNKSKRNNPVRGEVLIAGLFPLAQHSEASRLGRGVLPAALLARDHINHRHNLLANYELQLDVNNTACDAALGIKAFLDMLYKKPGRRLMVFGSACTEVTGPIAQASQFLHLAQLSYADTHPMYDHIKFPNLYRIVPSENQFNYARLELLRSFNWTYVATLYQNEPRYSLAHNHLMATGTDPSAQRYRLLVQRSFTDVSELRNALQQLIQKGARIIFGSFNETWARIVFCEAYKLNMYGRKYQWVIWGGYSKDWWMVDEDDVEQCSSDQLITSLNGYLSTDILPLSLDNEPTISKLTPSQYEAMYEANKGTEYSPFHGYTYDGVWAMAKAIGIVIQQLPPGTTIDMFEYKMPFWSERFLSALKDTEFVGVTGPVKFFNNERVGRILVKQFQVIDAASNSAEERIIALYHNDSSFMDFSVGTAPIFWHGEDAPRDRTIEVVRLEHIQLVVFITMAALSTAGIVMAISFLVFNTKNRHHKYIKMSSPYLNNMIILGCIMTYLSVVLLGIDTGLVSEDQIPAVCTARLWVLTIGFTLAFGAMFSKTWRVHAIFTNIKLNKKVIKDYQLFLIVALLLVFDLVILITWQLQDPLQYTTKSLQEFEDIKNDYLIKPQIGFCVSEHMTIYLGVNYAFKGILMAFGCFLAWETRHVTIPALNDSKYIGMSVYNVVIMCVIGVAISFILTDQQEYAFIIISVFIIFCTTITLCLVFVPKILELRRNPNPEAKRVRATLKATKSSKRESFSADMQHRGKQLQDQNTKLRESFQTKSSELDDLIKEIGDEARELLQKQGQPPRPRHKISFKGLTSDEEEPPSTSQDESGDRSDRWPLVEVSAAKCMYVHYKVRKNSVDGPTSVTVLSEPSSNNHRPSSAVIMPTITDADESGTPLQDTAKSHIFGGVYVGGADPVFSSKKSVKQEKPPSRKSSVSLTADSGLVVPGRGISNPFALTNSKGSAEHSVKNGRKDSINQIGSHRATSSPSLRESSFSDAIDLIEVSSPPSELKDSISPLLNHAAIPHSNTVPLVADKNKTSGLTLGNKVSSSIRCDVIASL